MTIRLSKDLTKIQKLSTLRDFVGHQFQIVLRMARSHRVIFSLRHDQNEILKHVIHNCIEDAAMQYCVMRTSPKGIDWLTLMIVIG